MVNYAKLLEVYFIESKRQISGDKSAPTDRESCGYDPKLTDSELFYEDIEGNIYNFKQNKLFPNIIVSVQSNPNILRVNKMKLKFPISKWRIENENKN